MTDNIISLDKLPLLKRGRIVKIGSDDIKNRLLDLGLVEGATIQALYENAFSNPRAYYIRDTLIAIRKREASLILVEPYN